MAAHAPRDDDPPMTEHDSPTTPPPAPRRLHRSADDRVLTGVAGGIAEHLGVDPVLVRLAFVALAALALAVGASVPAAADVDLRGGFVDRTVRPTSVAAIPDELHTGAGRITL